MILLRSALMWAVGSTFLILIFVIFSTGLLIFPRERVFALARFLFSVQTKLMGIRLKVTGLAHLDRRQIAIRGLFD